MKSDNLIIAFEGIGEANMYVVNDETFDLLFDLYENQEAGPQGYSNMMEKFWDILNEPNFKSSVYLQWNSFDDLPEPVTFNRILQVLQE